MKYIICTLVFYGFASARPQNKEYFRLARYENFNDGSGNYRYAFQINDDVFQEQNGELKSVNDNSQVTVMKGAYTVVTPDNVIHEVRYESDENGFRPQIVIAKQDRDSVNIHGKVSLQDQTTSASITTTVSTFTTNTASATDNAATTSSENLPATHSEASPPQVIAENTKQNLTNVIEEGEPEEFPDRIGTPVIITLQGAPGYTSIPRPKKKKS